MSVEPLFHEKHWELFLSKKFHMKHLLYLIIFSFYQMFHEKHLLLISSRFSALDLQQRLVLKYVSRETHFYLQVKNSREIYFALTAWNKSFKIIYYMITDWMFHEKHITYRKDCFMWNKKVIHNLSTMWITQLQVTQKFIFL